VKVLTRSLVNYLLFIPSISCTIVVMYILFSYPVSTGRLLMYVFLLIPLALIGADLGFNKALSKRIDGYLAGRKSLITQSLIIVIPSIIIMIWGMNYVNTLIKPGTQHYIGEMYEGDIYSIYLAGIPVALYIIYYYAEYIYSNYTVSKMRNKQLR